MEALSTHSPQHVKRKTPVAVVTAPAVVTTDAVVDDVDQSSTLDFIGDSKAVKGLFMLPYSTNQSISVAVHNLGGTLLIDSDPGHEELQSFSVDRKVKGSTNRLQSDNKNTAIVKGNTTIHQDDEKTFDTVDRRGSSPLSLPCNGLQVISSATSDALTIVDTVNSIIQSTSNDHVGNLPVNDTNEPVGDGSSLPGPDDYVHKYIPSTPEPREYLSWKFHDMNLLVGSNALIYRSANDDSVPPLTVRVEDTSQMSSLLAQHERNVGSGKYIFDRTLPKLQQQGRPSYAEVLRLSQIENETTHDKTDIKQRDTLDVETSENTFKKDSAQHSVASFAAPDYRKVKLQTCIIPSQTDSVGSLLSTAEKNKIHSPNEKITQETPVSTVLDTYLDNIMANVPQLALCLREKGFVQSVKLLKTESIPSKLLTASTIDTTKSFEMIMDRSPDDEIFSPQIMEMNASALLRFLKQNCTKDNATYLMRREAGQTNIQLYDISSISAQRQRKWIWWLAMISYRFANRLRQVSLTTPSKSLRRSFRERQRSLLQNTLDLLETLADMNGNAHESLVAAVMESLADTFLCSPEDDDVQTSPTRNSSTYCCSDSDSFKPMSPPPATSVSPQQPYAKSTVDALHKAQDHLTNGIKSLWPVLDSEIGLAKNSERENQNMDHVPVRSVELDQKDSDSDGNDSDDDASPNTTAEQIGPVVIQLFGLHRKLINVSLRLAEIHLRNYYSSSAMQALRIAARRISDSLFLVQLRSQNDDWFQNLLLQYTWLWEHCGHFARAYAADELWRERGHASGDDVISVLQDVELSFLERDGIHDELALRLLRLSRERSSLAQHSFGMLSLQELSGVVIYKPRNAHKVVSCSDGSLISSDQIQAAKQLMAKQKLLQRDQRKVLIAACIAYSLAIDALNDFASSVSEQNEGFLVLDRNVIHLLYQRLGDACNEVGKIFLSELRSALISLSTTDSKESIRMAVEPLLSSAEFWFLEGLRSFEKSNDLRNLALLRCNLCQCYKLRANNVFSDSNQSRATKASKNVQSHAEICVQEAANHLQAAHETLGIREIDPVTWDMVSGELAATYLVLGVRRRQSLIGSGTVPLISHELRLDHGRERGIVDPMERALHIYEQMGNHHQAAATQYQLALFYAKIWTCQRDEAKTREKLSLAFKHYGLAFNFFSRCLRGNEATFCLLCLDLASLYAAVSGKECLAKALLRCLDTADAFSEESIRYAASQLQTRDEWLDKMQTVADSVEERVFKLLRSLIKLDDEEKAGTNMAATYKDLYRIGLQAKISCGTKVTPISVGDAPLNALASKLLQLHSVLSEIAAKVPR